jgi:hypothetical protein
MTAALDPLVLYRDEGPLARAIGDVAGRRVPLPPAVLVALGGLPLAAAAALAGDGAGNAAAAAVVAWLVLLGGLAAGAPNVRLAWATPAVVRAAEYGGLLWLAALSGARVLPAAFALLCALAYRHYELAYRLRFQRRAPPAWVGTVAGGWEGRLVVALVLVLTGAARAGYWVAAAALAAVFVGESITSWREFDDEGDAA